MTNWPSTKERDNVGKVTDFLIEQIKKQITENHIVVWFDWERGAPQYTVVIKDLEIPDATIIRYDGSFLKMRYEASPLMIKNQAPNLLMYVPMEEKDTENALVGFTKTGIVIKPGQSPWQRNTRLAVIARQALKSVMSETEINDLEKKIEGGNLSLQDLDNLAEKTSRINTNTLALIFNTHNPSEITLKFLATSDNDEEINSRSALPDLISLFEAEFGLSCRGKTSDECRNELVRYLLFTAWSQEIKGKIPAPLKDVSRATEPALIRTCVNLVESWRKRNDLAESYRRHADTIEHSLGIGGYSFAVSTIQNSDTFCCIDDQIFHHVVVELQKVGTPKDDIQKLIAQRKNNFWSLQDSNRRMRWKLLQTLVEFYLRASAVETELKTKEWTAEECVQKYSQKEKPWSAIDTLCRRFEERYDAVMLESNFQSDDLNVLCKKARAYYMTVGDLLARKYQKAIEKQRGFPQTILKQQETFDTIVRPHIGQERIAYILVDALRYEMAQEFVSILGKEFETNLEPAIGIMPSITELGMAALLPGAQKGVVLERAGTNDLSIKIDNVPVPDRKSRIKYLKDHCDTEFVDLKLGDLYGSSKPLKDKVEKAPLAVVTSQEIDLLGESVESGQFRRYMSDIFSSLKRAIFNLERSGFTTFVITADHGFIFGEEISGSMKIDPPGGNTILIKRRIWVGEGGARHESTLRFPAQQFGYPGEFDLVIPQGFAVFTVSGGGLTYMHGGLSLQEHIIPVMTIKVKTQAPITESKIKWNVTLSAGNEITTRACIVLVEGKFASIDNTPPKIRIEIRQNGMRISRPLIASYGYEEATGDVQLKVKADSTEIEQVSITLQIPGKITSENATLHLIDAQTGAEYAKILNIPMKITF